MDPPVSELATLDHRLLAQHRFALVASERLGQLPAGIEGRRVARGAFRDSAELMPTLIELNRLETARVDELLECAERDRALGNLPVLSALLDSDASVEQAEYHLAATQERRGPSGAKAWLRVHDPRVWLHLPRVLGDVELRAVFGPANAWTVFYGDHWITTHPPFIDHARQRFTPDAAAQWAALERVGAVNRVLGARGWMSRHDLEARGAAIDSMVVRGRSRHGLHRMTDLVAYASLGIGIHPRFDEASVALEAIEEHERERGKDGCEPDSSIVDALQVISSDQWLRARRELEADARQEPSP